MAPTQRRNPRNMPKMQIPILEQREKKEEGKMNKTEYTEKHKEQLKDWKRPHLTRAQVYNQRGSRKRHRKDGEHYKKQRIYQMTGTPHIKDLIRKNHAKSWRSYKQIIAPESQIHHEWIPSTADYTGVALVEADQHMHGYIDVIRILDGEITVLTEAEIRELR